MDYLQLIIFAVFALVVGRFVNGRLKYGSWTGSFLKGSISPTAGEVTLSQSVGGNQTLAVHVMNGSESEESFVGLVLVSKAMLAASMQPLKLSKAEAQELSRLLSHAAQ